MRLQEVTLKFGVSVKNIYAELRVFNLGQDDVHPASTDLSGQLRNILCGDIYGRSGRGARNAMSQGIFA